MKAHNGKHEAGDQNLKRTPFSLPDTVPALLNQSHLPAGCAACCLGAQLSQCIPFISYEKRKGLMWFLNNANNGQRGLLDWSQTSEIQAIHQTCSSSFSCYSSPFPLGRSSVNLVLAGQKGWHGFQTPRTNKVENKDKRPQENDKMLSLLHPQLQSSTLNAGNTNEIKNIRNIYVKIYILYVLYKICINI